MTKTAEVIEFNPSKITAFNEFKSQLVELKTSNSKAVFDYESPKGNKEARSHIYKLRQTKSAVESARKEAKDAALQYGREVDSKAKELKAEIDNMISVHEQPLKEIEDREEKRVQAHKDRIAKFSEHEALCHDADSETIGSMLADFESVVIDDSFEEFQSAAAIAKDQALTALKERLEARKKYEDEQAELERLRKEKEDREKKDREERIAREAAEKAMREAKEREEREAKEREERAERERLEREKQEAERKAELERAQREKAEAEQRAALAEKQAKEKAERELAEKQERERKEAEAREANKRHKAKINNQALKALVSKSGISQEQAKSVVESIAKGEIPNVSISY